MKDELGLPSIGQFFLGRFAADRMPNMPNFPADLQPIARLISWPQFLVYNSACVKSDHRAGERTPKNLHTMFIEVRFY